MTRRIVRAFWTGKISGASEPNTPLPLGITYMHTQEARIRGLETRVARLSVLSSGLALCTMFSLWGALTAPPSPEPKSITCSELRIVDAEGRLRIRAQALDPGNASVTLRDREGRVRVAAGTFDDGAGGLALLDASGKERIAMETLLSGESTARWSDAGEKVRVGIGTFLDGRAAVDVLDKVAKTSRISLATDDAGVAAMQVFDTKGKARYGTGLDPIGWVMSTWYDKAGVAKLQTGVGPANEVLMPSQVVEVPPLPPPVTGVR